jgi:hypothetical protein
MRWLLALVGHDCYRAGCIPCLVGSKRLTSIPLLASRPMSASNAFCSTVGVLERIQRYFLVGSLTATSWYRSSRSITQ